MEDALKQQTQTEPPSSSRIEPQQPQQPSSNDADQKPRIGQSFVQSIVRFWRSITVEPVVICYLIALFLMALADQNMYLEKACSVNQNFSAEVCAKLMQRDNEDLVEEDRLTEDTYNGIQVWTKPLASWLSVCLVLFWGAWSDRSGLRKPCIIFPLIAQLVISLTNLLTSSVFVRTPLEVPMFSNAIVDGLSGGAGTLLVGVYSYLSDVTPPDQLSYRVGMTNVCLLVGNILGNAVSGLAVRYMGFLGVYSLAASFFVFSIWYTAYFIKESNLKDGRAVTETSPPAAIEGSFPAATAATATTETPAATSKLSLVRQFFDLDLVVQTFRVFRKDERNPKRRPIIILLLIIWVLIAGPVQSEGSLVYLFTRRQYKWTEVEQSFFSTFGSITSLVGNTFIVEVLSNRLQCTDATLAIIGLISKLLANCVYAVAVVAWIFFAGCVVEALNSGMGIAMRSIAAKAVGSDEVGKMNALLALVESAVPLIFVPLYVYVYSATRDDWPNAFLALGVLLLLPAMPAFIWMGRYFKPSAADSTDVEGKKTSVELSATAHDNQSFEPDAVAAAERIKSNAETTYL